MNLILTSTRDLREMIANSFQEKVVELFGVLFRTNSVIPFSWLASGLGIGVLAGDSRLSTNVSNCSLRPFPYPTVFSNIVKQQDYADYAERGFSNGEFP